MKLKQFLLSLLLLNTTLSTTGCQRNKYDAWDDTKSAGRHISRGVQALTGRHSDSRQIRNRQDFECIDDEFYQEYPSAQDYEYVPLEDQTCDDVAMAEIIVAPPRESPGDPDSSVPGISAFRDPATIPQLAGIFQNVYFAYNSSMVRGSENLQVVQRIADYMKRNPDIYIFVEGHTDERGPQAYNLALGSRRSNAVRNVLVSEGANPDHIFTISYGKERPLILEPHEEGWAKNRRAEFKIYER